MLLIPYRAKNPPEQFPYATYGLIAVNALVFAVTCNTHLQVRQGALDALSFSHNNINLLRILTAMFLHADIFHIAGNMLFLWLFGASVEGRLGPWKFLGLYLFSGLVGAMLADVMMGLVAPDMPNLGASGAIMGLGGAYLYMFQYSTICIWWGYWLGMIPRMGISQWHARWVLLYFIGFDVLRQVIFHGGDGVGHFAHIGGFGAGLFAAYTLNARRDTLGTSDAKALHADMKDYSYLALPELEALMQHPTRDPLLILAYCDKLLLQTQGAGEQRCLGVLQHYGPILIEEAEPTHLAAVVLRLPLAYAQRIPGAFLMRLGARLERVYSNDYAVRVYRRITEIDPQSQDTETALFRLGRLMDQVFMNPKDAHYYYSELLKRFPMGPMAADTRMALTQLIRRVNEGAVPTGRT